MNTFILNAREKIFEIQMALPGLANTYEGLIIKQKVIYDSVYWGVEMMEMASFMIYSNIVIQSQVFVANVKAAFVVMKTQSNKAYKKLWSALSKLIHHFGKARGIY
jgi:hypothetical protein